VPCSSVSWGSVSGLRAPGRRPGVSRGSMASGRLTTGRCPGVPRTWHLSNRVQHTQRKLLSVGQPCVIARHRPQVFEPERVAASPDTQQRGGILILLACESARRRGVLRRADLGGVVATLLQEVAPAGREVVNGRRPYAVAADAPVP